MDLERKEDGMKLTAEEIDAAKTENGGWTKATLEGWGISWPPARGWKKKLIEGFEPKHEANAPESNPNGLEARLLHEVVMAVIQSGNGDLLKDIDELNAYYDSRIPTVEDIVGSRPPTAVIEGGITWEDRVYRFSVARMVTK
jgi:hypothetical protein